jgi:cbb3-type cytochrome oxidase maturation protein
MSVIFIVLPLALVVVLAAVIAFLWAARRGQFDDLTTPALRALHEDQPQQAREEPGASTPADERP